MVTTLVGTIRKNPAATTITATLVEDVGGAPIEGQTVTFTRLGVNTNINTNSSGQAVFSHNSAEDVTVTAPSNFLVSGNTRGLIANGGASDLDESTGAVTVIAGSGNTAISGRYFVASLPVNLIKRSNEQCAPESIIFEAVPTGFPGVDAPTGGNIYDPRKHVECTWNCGQAKTFSYPSNTFGSMTNGNYAETTLMGVTYEAPGTYTPTATAKMRHNGYVVQAVGSPTSVVVQDIETVASDKFYVSAAGTKAGFTSQTTYQAAFTALSGKTGPVLVEFADGETFDIGYYDAVRVGVPSVYFRREGGGAMPILNWVDVGGNPTAPWQNNNYDATKVKDWVVSGLDLRGGWDAATNTGDSRPLWNVLSGSGPDVLTFSGCKLSGWSMVVNANDDDTSGFFWDNDVTDWRAYGLSIGGYLNCFARGNRLADDVLAKSGGGSVNQHGSLRVSRAAYMVVCQNDMFNRKGWTINYAVDGNNVYTQQACFRFGTSSDGGEHYSVWGNGMEGGFETMSMFPANNTMTINPCNYVIQSNLLVSSWQGENGLRLFYGGGSIRNNIIVAPDTNRDETTDFDWVFKMGYSNDTNPHVAENLTAPILIEHNTVINRLTDANSVNSTDAAIDALFDDATGQFAAQTTLRNNLVHEPGASLGTTYTNMDLTTIYNSRMTHHYDALTNGTNVPTYSNVNYGTNPLNTPTLGIPGTASDAAGAVTTATLIYDALGQERDATGDDLGAVKAA